MIDKRTPIIYAVNIMQEWMEEVMQPKVKISDVARMAGVSIATVSRVLNDKGKVRETTRNEVYMAMRKLNYRISDKAERAAVRNILMRVPNIGNPFYSQILDGAQDVAGQHGYNVLLMQSQNKGEHGAENDGLRINVDMFAGMLLLHAVSPEQLLWYSQIGIPFVQCSEYTEGNDISCVGIDDALAAKKAAEYLISLGRTKIAFLNSSFIYQYARKREAGFIAALQQARVPLNPNWVFHFPEVAFDIAFPSVMQLLQQPEIPDAIFAISDVFAAAAVKAARRLNIRVPEELIIVGFDNVEISSMIEPSITTINQPRYQLGALACNMLIERIENPGVRPQKLMLDTHLIVRESSLL